jgi:hypothetical protein
VSAKRAPLDAICCMTFAWSGLVPLGPTKPQSPKTAKEYGVLDPLAI